MPSSWWRCSRHAPGAGGLANFASGLPLSPSMYFTYAEQNRTFQSLGVWTGGPANVTGLAEPEAGAHGLVSDGVLETLDVPPAAGALADRSRPGSARRARPVMLSYGYWQRRFGGDRSVIGRNIKVDSQPRQIVGVMPRGFRFVDAGFRSDCAAGASIATQLILAGFGFQGIARLKPGVDDRAGECGSGAADAGLDGLLAERSGQQSALV